VTDCEILKTAVFSPGDLCGHGAKVHGVLDDIGVAGDELWVYGLEEEGVIVLSGGERVSHVFQSWDAMSGHFLIWAMSFERTSLSGFSLRGLGGAFWPSSKATDFRFLDIFIVESGGETPVWEDGKEWNGRTDRW